MCTVALRGTGGVWRTAVADITSEVKDMQELINNLGHIKLAVAPTSHATVLLMPSQAFMKHGALMSVMLLKQGRASDLSWGWNTECRRSV